MNVFSRRISKSFVLFAILLSVGNLACCQTDESSVEPLITALNNPNDLTRERAADTLGFRKEARAVSALIPLLKDRNESVRYTTARALGNIGDPIAVEPLIEYLTDNPKSHGGTCNYAAVQALGKFNDARAVMPLFSQMGNGCGYEIPKAIGSAGVEPMIEIVTSGSPGDRAHAVWVLGFIADECALDTLISVLGDKESGVAFNAVNAIVSRIGKSAVEPLRQAFENPDLQVQIKINIIYVLARIPDERAGEALIELVQNSEHPMGVRHILVETLIEAKKNRLSQNNDYLITALLAAMDDQDVNLRNSVIRALGDEQREDVFAIMFEAMSAPATSAEASIVVGRRKDLRALPYLLEALKSDPFGGSREAQVLSLLGDSAVEGLISVLIDKNKEFPLRELGRQRDEREFPRCGNDEPRPNLDPRVHAAYALGEIGDHRARIPLTKALKDEAEWLREAAAAALNKLGK